MENLDKLVLLQTPAEQARILSEAPEVIAETIEEEQTHQDSTGKE